MNTPRLNILLLGPPAVTMEGKPVLIKRRLNRALFYYLAAKPHPATREEVCNLFWPDELEVVARKKLREALSRIRTSLGVNDLLISVGEQLFLNPELVWVDYREWFNLVSPLMSSSEMAGSALMPEWMVTQLKQAIALCRTWHFMQGMTLSGAVGFENWHEVTDQAYRYAIAKVIDRLVDHYISSGNLVEALLWLRKGLQVSPLDEDWNYLALICLRDTGRIPELISYATYLEELYQQQEETLPARFTELKKEALEIKTPVTGESVEWPEEETGEAPFVGRENELEALNKAMRRRGVVLLSGEAGIGKTRLLKQFFVSQPFPPRLFYCRANPLAVDVPFHSIVNSLRIQIKESDWLGLDPGEREKISTYYHQYLQDPVGSAIHKIGGEWLPVMDDVYFAFMRLLHIVAARRPLLFIIDDAMWIDQASISLIAFLIDQKFFDKYGLLVIVKSPEVNNLPLDALLQRVRRSRKLETISLEPLQDAEIGLFVQRVMGRVPSKKMIGEMHRLTGGNPYFLSECLRSMNLLNIESESFFVLEECNPPEPIFALVMDKLNGLEKDSVNLVRGAAILGRKFCVDVVEAVTGISGEKLVNCIDELIQEGFIRVNSRDKAAASYVFRHDIERQVVVQQLGPARRRHLHLRAANALQKRRGKQPDFSEDIARHYQSAGETRLAAQAWLEAGRYARSQYSKDDAYIAYGKALDLICQSPAGFDERLIYDVVNEWGNFAHDHDDQRTCEHIYQCCLNAGEATHSLLLTGAGLSGLGRAADFLFEYEKSAEYFERAIFYLSGTEYHSEHVKALSRLGIMRFGMDEYTQSLSLLTEALRLDPGGKDQDSLDNRVNILSYLCFLYIFTGEPKKAGEIADEMARLSVLVKRRSARVQAHALLAMTQYFNGRVQEALQTCRNTRPLAESLQVRFWLSLLELVEGMACLHTGNLDQSWYFIDRVHQREANYPQEKLFMQAIKVKGDIFRSLGERKKAHDFYDVLLDTGFLNYPTIESRSMSAILLVEEGKTVEGYALMERSINEAEQKKLYGISVKGRLYTVLLNLAGGSAEKFEREAGRLQKEISQRELLLHEAFEGWVPVITAELRGEKELALALCCDLQQRVVERHNVWAEFQVLRKILQLSAGKGAEGLRARERVNELLTTMGLTATSPAVKSAFQRFRNQWRRYVNAVST